MTSEEHQSILKAAVSYAIEETKRICFAEMDQAMAELTEAHVASAMDAIQRARAEQAAEIERLKSHLEDAKEIIQKQIKQAAELAKFKALAETLARALEAIRSEAQREEGSWLHLKRCIAAQSAEALREYKEARDA